MKKITAFFMALFPFLVVGLLFATELIYKNFSDKTVSSIEVKEELYEVKNESGKEMESEVLVGEVNVFPASATDPTVYWTSEDTSIVEVEKETGKLTCKENGYGDVKLNVVAKTNAQAKAKTTVKVWDNKIHDIIVKNQKQVEFLTPDSQTQLDIVTVPNERIAHPELKYSIDGDGKVQVSQTGLITTNSEANGEYHITIETHEGFKKTVTVQVGSNGITSIGFQNIATEVLTGSSYNLYDNVITYPYSDKSKIAADYFTYESSNPEMATVDQKTGVVSFTSKYTPGTPIDFVVKFAGLPTISAVKTLISSMKYHESVSFSKYEYTEKVTIPSKIEDDSLIPHTYPDNGTNDITIESSDPSVISIEDGVLLANKAGKVTLTAKAKSSETTNVTDSVTVTVLDANQKIFVNDTIDLGTSHYYPLRKNLNSIFADKNITWSQVSTTGAGVTFDKDNEIVYIPNTGSIKVKAKDTISGLEEDVTISCSNDDSTVIDVASVSEETITAGQKVIFKSGANPIALTTVPDQLKAGANKGEYIAIHGSQGTIDLSFEGSATLQLAISEPIVSLKASDGKDWTNYTTNGKKFNIGTKLVPYPATATYIDAWSGAQAVVPTYEVVIDDDSVATYDEDTKELEFLKPGTVTIKASAQDVLKTFKVTSTCGKYGKFSLTDGTTNAPIEFGSTVTINPGVTMKATIDDFFAQDVTELSSDVFKDITYAVSEENVVSITPKTEGGKIIFEITGKMSGTDIVKISNGQFTFVFNVKVADSITKVDLYCMNEQLATEENIKVYDADAVLNIDIQPLVASKEPLTLKWNNDAEKSYTDRTIKLSKLGTLETNNTLVIKNSKGELLATYKFVNAIGQTPTYEITDIYGIKATAGSNFYLAATESYATMKIVLDGIATQNYFKDFKTSFEAQSQVYGRYIITKIDDPSRAEYKQEIKVTDGKNEKTYTLLRDVVSRIELPKHDNNDDSDAKGLQRVHVYGNETQLAGKEKTQIYSIPVNVYDYQGILIEDKDNPDVKNNAIATLQLSNTRLAKAEYNKTTQMFEVDFDENYLYTWQEMFNNKFAELENNKNQIFNVTTAYGATHPLADSFAYYSFVVVKGVNVYDQKGIEDAQKSQDKSIVLQTNFGLTEDPTKPIKDDTPFELTTFNFNEVYGNGYSINFHAATKAAGASDKTVSCKHGFNVNMIGCYYDQFTGLNHRALTFSNGGDCAEDNPDTWAYSTFTSFHQPLTIWCASGKQSYAHIKNCLFFNDQEYCRNAISISDAGNTTTIENCAFFNAAKIAIMCNKSALIQLKGNIDVYNFHGSDMFDCMGWSATVKKIAWDAVQAALEAGNVIQGLDYGSVRPVANAYLFTTLGGEVKFYDHTEGGKDVYVYSEHGSEKAANYLKHAAGLWGLLEIWSTTKPPLPLQAIHSPAFTDEFINGEQLNYNTRNLLIQRITRW